MPESKSRKCCDQDVGIRTTNFDLACF